MCLKTIPMFMGKFSKNRYPYSEIFRKKVLISRDFATKTHQIWQNRPIYRDFFHEKWDPCLGISCNSIHGILTIVTLSRIPFPHRVNTRSHLILTKSAGSLFNSTVLSGHSEEHEQDSHSCTANLLSECIPQSREACKHCPNWTTSTPPF